jgi:lipoprotein signal peptidase
VTDQVTKGLAHYVARSDNGGWLDPVLNPDLLLSLYSGAPALLVALAFTALLGFSLHLLRLTRSGTLSGWVAGLLVGGAVSNLLDRFAGGMVRDWLSLPWAVANLADLAVAAGALGYLAAITRWVVAESEAPSTGAPLAG